MNKLILNDLEESFSNSKFNFSELKNKKVFITGGTGFFGIWLIYSFLYLNKKHNLNSKLIILTRDKSKFTATHSSLADNSVIDFIEGDIRSFEFPQAHFDYIIHGANKVSGADKPQEILDVIVNGTKHILKFAKICRIKKLMYISSGAVYGKQPDSILNMDENHNFAPSTADLHSSYGHAKRFAEFLCHMEGNQSGFEVSIARGFAFLGPYLPLDTNFAIGNFIRDVLLNNDIIIQSDGSSLRSYLYSSDLALWLWTILIYGHNCQVYNVGSQRSVSIEELARLMIQTFNVNLNIHISKDKIKNKPIDRYIPNTDKAKIELGLNEFISLEEGIQKTVQWQKMKEHEFDKL